MEGCWGGLFPLIPPVSHTPLLALQSCVLYFISPDFFADKCRLSCCAGPLTLSVDTTPKPGQICLTNELSLLPTRVLLQLNLYTWHMLCAHMNTEHTDMKNRWENGRFNSEHMTSSCHHDPASPSPFCPLSSIFQLFCHFSPTNLSHTPYSSPSPTQRHKVQRVRCHVWLATSTDVLCVLHNRVIC